MRNKQSHGAAARIKKVIFWVGSLSGILISLLAIYEKALEPRPAKLTITFFETGTQTLSLVPPINTASEMTEEIPLQLKVENLGGKASANTKLYLSHNPSLEMTAQYQKETKQTWNAPNEPMRQLSLALENINPGESYLIPVKIRFQVSTDVQRAMADPSSTQTDPKLLPLYFAIYSDLSSDTVPNRRIVLEILLGRCNILKERDANVFWVGHGHGSEGVEVLKVKEDYPCQ